jgi:hypothetical protein
MSSLCVVNITKIKSIYVQTQLNSIYLIELHVSAYRRLPSSSKFVFKYIPRNVSTNSNPVLLICTHKNGEVIFIYVFCFIPDNGRMERWILVVGK